MKNTRRRLTAIMIDHLREKEEGFRPLFALCHLHQHFAGAAGQKRVARKIAAFRRKILDWQGWTEKILSDFLYMTVDRPRVG